MTAKNTESKDLAEENASLRRRIAELEAELTSQKHQQENLLSRNIIRNAHEGYIVYGQDLHYKVWNKYMETMTGRTAAEVIGKHPLELFPFIKDAGIYARLEEALAGEVPSPIEFPFDGVPTCGWFVDSSAPLRDEAGKIVGVIGTVQDITERKSQEDLTRTRLHLFEYAVGHTLHEVLRETLDEAERLTRSRIGFYHFMGADQKTLTLQAWSTRTTEKFCTAVGAGAHYNLDEAGVWADCVRERGPLIHNDYASLAHKKGMPEGHAQVVRELVVPILREGQVVAILGVGNKETDYTQHDVEIINDLANGAWEVAERKRATEQLRESEERDLAHRKQAEALLRQSEQKLREILDASPFPTALVDTEDEHIQYWSRSAQEKFGHTPSTTVEWYQAAYPDPDYRADVIEQWKPFLEVARKSLQPVNTGEYRVTCADGRILECELYAMFLGSNLVVTFNDITDRKRAEDLLRQSEQRLAFAVRSTGAGVWDWDVLTNHMSWDTHMMELYGLTRQTFSGSVEAWKQGLHPDDKERAIAEYQEALDGKRPFDTEFRVRHPDGTIRHIKAEGLVLRDAEGTAVRMIGLNRDITTRKKVEEEREELEAALLQAQKMESVGRLAGGVAHDFNNMLNVMLGHVELALTRPDTSDPLRHHLNQILKAGERSADLTNRLLAFARKQTIAPKVLQLNTNVSSMLQMLKRVIGENIELLWRPAPDLWPARLDPSQINQVLVNLCVNARDAIKGVGEVTIDTANVTVKAETSSAHPGLPPGEYVRLRVTDNGCGMNEQTRTHLFEPFFTTKPMGKGTGLGLAMVYGVVKQNEGFIEVDSAPDQGARFSIYLPRYQGKVDWPEVKDTSPPQARGEETILLVEDDPSVLEVTTIMLTQMGYTVLVAHTPHEALRLAQNRNGEIQLLITDVVMPEMNGRDLSKKLTSLYPGLKRLFMSGYTADVIAHHGVLEEGVHFIQKPFQIEVLAAKVREALQRG